jgi:hypothetical protein
MDDIARGANVPTLNGLRVRWLGVECELELDQLVAAAIAGGDDQLITALTSYTAAELRTALRAEALHRAEVLLTQAGGDRGRAYDLLLAERRRWAAG